MSGIGSGAAKLAMGRGLSVVIGLVTAPIIARLFTPSEFGIAGIVQSVGAWAAGFACLGYAESIPLSASRGETRAIVRLCLILTAALVPVSILLPLVGGRPLADVMAEPLLRKFVWFLPLIFLTASLSQVAQYACAKEGRFGALALSSFLGENLAHAAQIALASLLGGAALWLLLGNVMGAIAGVLVVVFLVMLPVLNTAQEPQLARETVFVVAKRHSQFPKVQVWSTVLNTASRSIPMLMLGGLFGVDVVGLYAYAERVLFLPLSILGKSIAQAFYPAAANEWNETGTISETITKAIRILSLICVFPIVAVGMLGSLLFETIFGSQWHEAGVYSQILAPWLLVVLLASPVSSVFLIRKHASTPLCYNVILLVGRPGALLLGQFLGGPRSALICFSAVGAAVFTHQLGRALRLGRASRWRVGGLVLRELMRAAVLLLPASVVYWLGGAQSVCLAILCTATVAHLAILYLREPMVRAWTQALLPRFQH